MTTTFGAIHPAFADFDAVYTDDLLPHLRKLEAERQSKLKLLRKGFIVAPLVGLVVGIIMRWQLGASPGMYLAGLAVALLVLLFFYLPLASLNRKAHNLILPRVAESLGMTYREKGFSPPHFQLFRDLDLLPGYDRKTHEDLITGKRHEAGFLLYESHLQTKHTDKDGNTTWTTVFHGYVMRLDYPHDFLGKTIVKRDAGFFNSMSKPGREFSKVGMASPRFEKAFEAWSTDQVEARHLLDPVVLERFLELENLFNGKRLRAAFADGSVWIAVETGDKMKAGAGFKSYDSEDRVVRLLKDFAAIYNLVDVLIMPLEQRMEGTFSVDDLHRK